MLELLHSKCANIPRRGFGCFPFHPIADALSYSSSSAILGSEANRRNAAWGPTAVYPGIAGTLLTLGISLLYINLRKKNKLFIYIYMKIKDVPISKKSSMGTMETLGEIHYHYQKYDNIFNFFDILMKKNDDIKKVLCIPDVGRKWMRSFLKVNLNIKLNRLLKF